MSSKKKKKERNARRDDDKHKEIKAVTSSTDVTTSHTQHNTAHTLQHSHVHSYTEILLKFHCFVPFCTTFGLDFVVVVGVDAKMSSEPQTMEKSQVVRSKDKRNFRTELASFCLEFLSIEF